MDIAARWAIALWDILVEAGVWLLAGFVVAGLLHALVPRAWIERQLSGRWGVLKGALLGAPIPLCSCSVIPFAAGVRARGASKGASTSIAISSPEVDLPAIGLTWALLGPVMAIVRPVVALISAISAGLLIDRFCDDRGEGSPGDGPSASSEDCCSASASSSSCCSTPSAEVSCCSKDEPPASSCCSHTREDAPASSCCHEKPMRREPWIVRALRYSFVTLPADLGVWMGIGLGLSALIMVLIPPGWIQENLTGGELGAWASRLLMLGVGVPLYICATASTPLAAALIAAGLSPGAALIFLLAGPATNPATMAWVLKDLGVRALGIYLGVIAIMSLAAGTILDMLLPNGLGKVSEILTVHEHAGLWDQVAGGVLAIVLGVGIVRSLSTRLGGLLRGQPRACAADA